MQRSLSLPLSLDPTYSHSYKLSPCVLWVCGVCVGENSGIYWKTITQNHLSCCKCVRACLGLCVTLQLYLRGTRPLPWQTLGILNYNLPAGCLCLLCTCVCEHWACKYYFMWESVQRCNRKCVTGPEKVTMPIAINYRYCAGIKIITAIITIPSFFYARTCMHATRWRGKKNSHASNPINTSYLLWLFCTFLMLDSICRYVLW